MKGHIYWFLAIFYKWAQRFPWTTPPGVAWPGICICSRAQPSPKKRYKQNQWEIFLLYRIQNYINHTYVVGPRNCTKKQIQVLCSTTMKRNGSRAMTKDPFGWLLGCLNQVAARDVWSRYIGHAEAFSGCSGCTTTIVHKFPWQRLFTQPKPLCCRTDGQIWISMWISYRDTLHHLAPFLLSWPWSHWSHVFFTGPFTADSLSL